MEILVTDCNVTVDKKKLHPTLSVMLFVRYERQIEMPIFTGGRMMTEDGIVVGYAQDDHAVGYGAFISALDGNETAILERSANRYAEQKFILNVPLDAKAIDHIEKIRERNKGKNVVLNFVFGFNVFQIEHNFKEKMKGMMAVKIRTGEPHLEAVPVLKMNCMLLNLEHSISQSQWIQNFCEGLGIGKFLLLEMRIPQVNNLHTDWKELIERACDRLEKIEVLIQKGEWYEAIEKSRKIAELFLHKEKKSVQESVNKEKLRQLFVDANLTDKAFENFCNIIFHLFEYVSKFQHEKDHDGSYLLTPTPNREDAYFVYGLCVNLVNLISNKIKP